jgi:hypothetical protein
MAGWLQGQGSVMHFYMAQRVANRLDTEIRVLSRKLPEQMIAGPEQGGGSMNLSAAKPACSLLCGILPTLEDNSLHTGKLEGLSLREVLHMAPVGSH